MKKRKPASPVTKTNFQMMNAVSKSFIGPLPPPDMLRDYQDSLPGLNAADRIITMAEKQMNQRHIMERRILWSEITGTVFAGLIAIGGLIAGTFLINNDKSVSGLITMLTPLGAICGAFVYNKKKEKSSQN